MIQTLRPLRVAAILAFLAGAAIGHLALGAEQPDGRNIAAGYPIPKEGYCDQPYVVITKDGNWLCLLTTGPGTESQKHQHVVATTSADRGKTWSMPIDIEPGNVPGWRMASWVVPLITPSGRVYAFYDYDGDGVKKMPNGKPVRECLLGWYCYRYSDDNGRTWSNQRYRLPVRVTEADRRNEWQGQVQMLWGIDKPTVFNRGRSVIFAFSKLGQYIADKGEGWFFRSDNILTEPDAAKIQWQMLPDGEYGVRHPDFGSVQEEHNVVELDSGELYCVYRTVMGFLGQSTSRDGGHTWSTPVPMTYQPGGRVIKHNRACPMLWKTSQGKYLFWFHNNGTKDYEGRNPVWITGGIEQGGAILWSEPEILLYDEDPTILGMSYPDLIEQDGRFWVTETQKTMARIHAIDRTLLEGLWNQSENRDVATEGLVLALEGKAVRAKQVAMPKLAPLNGQGFSLDFQVRLDDLAAGQVLLDWRDAAGKGGLVCTTAAGTIQIELGDGRVKSAWGCDPALLQAGHMHHMTIIVDGGPRIITLLVDGRVCDGGSHRTYGWGRFDKALEDVNGARLWIAPSLAGELLLLRVYDRCLRTSEAVGNYRASAPARPDVQITRRIEPGSPFTATDGTTYDPAAGERFIVNSRHQIPADMVVQGDTVVLTAVGPGIENASDVTWKLTRAAGRPRLSVDPQNPLVARFLADGYGENVIEFAATVRGKRIVAETTVLVEFSTANMLTSGEPVAMPPDAGRNPLVRPFKLQILDHREQVTARNPQTGRLVTLWQVKFGGGDDAPMGVAVMTSDDHGLGWKDKRFLFVQEPSNSGWGSIGWNPAGAGGRGEFLLWTCSHVRSDGNRLMLLRSRDNAETWQHVGDFQKPISEWLGRPNARLVYFGVNRTIATRAGRLVTPMISNYTARVTWSDDDGRSWHGSNLDESFPAGTEDAVVETIDGRRLLLVSRPKTGNLNHCFQSTDGARTWVALADLPLPTAVVNLGLGRIDEPGMPEHGRIVYSAAATRKGPHKGRQRFVVAINSDPVGVDPGQWDTRLLWDATCNYSDVMYVPEDKSLLATVETINPGKSSFTYAAIRSFKMSLRYWRHLPKYEEPGH